jgi:hypothetical protein
LEGFSEAQDQGGFLKAQLQDDYKKFKNLS